MAIRLLLDEDVRVVLAEILRGRGYDAKHVLELDRGGASDADQLDYASSEKRALLSHNIRDFVLLDRKYKSDGRAHAGIIVSDQVPLGELLRRILRLLSRVRSEQARDQVLWLQDYRSTASSKGRKRK